MNDYQKSIDWQCRTKSVQGISYKRLIQVLLSACIYFLSFLWCSLTPLLLKMPPFLSLLSIFYLSACLSLRLPIYLSFSLSQLYLYILYFYLFVSVSSSGIELCLALSSISNVFVCLYLRLHVFLSLSPLSEVTCRRHIKLGCVLVSVKHFHPSLIFDYSQAHKILRQLESHNLQHRPLFGDSTSREALLKWKAHYN